MCKSRVFLVALVGIFCVSVQAAFCQAVLGDWLGSLDTGAVTLRIGLHISASAEGKLVGKLDSPDQGVMGIPINAVSLIGEKLSLAMSNLGASFEGGLSKEATEIAGTFTQGGVKFPLIFRKSAGTSDLNRPQNPKRPFPYQEEEVTYENKTAGIALGGTLTWPRSAGPVPVVLLLTGSGAQDRDESMFGHKPFLVLADHLTRLGIAVLRVDDRGVGKSTGSLTTTTLDDLAADALAGVEFLKGRKELDNKQIGLIGHSEGALIAGKAAAKSSSVAFIVMMAGSGVIGEDLLYAQAEATMKAAGATVTAIRQNQELQRMMFTVVKREKDNAAARQQILEAIAKFKAQKSPGELAAFGNFDAQMEGQIRLVLYPSVRDLITYDPAFTLKMLMCPVLAISGERDRQVPAQQNLPAIAAALAAGANPDHTIAVLPKLNHLFQTSDTGSPKEYGTIEETIAPSAMHTISDWLLRHMKMPAEKH